LLCFSAGWLFIASGRLFVPADPLFIVARVHLSMLHVACATAVLLSAVRIAMMAMTTKSSTSVTAESFLSGFIYG
jgi:hypothetical protein